MVIAIHTDHFLCHVGITFHIPLAIWQHVFSVCRYMNGQLIILYAWIKIQILHNADDLCLRHFNTKDTVDLGNTYLHFCRLYGITGVDIHMGRGYLTAAKLFDQMQGTLHAKDSGILIHTLFVTGTGIRTLAKASCRLSDTVSCELGRLEHNAFCSITDLRIQSSHNACKGYRLHAVTDHQIIRCHLIFLLIQGNDFLCLLCSSDTDRIALQIRAVKRMHRLSDLF